MSHVPRYRTPLVGRAAAVRRVSRLLATPGALVSLVGPGGVGKTRLAAELARATPGAVFVDLTGATDQDLALALVLGALGRVSPTTGNAQQEVLAALAANPPGMLVLDAAEWGVAPIAALVDALLAAGSPCPILVTSRVPLGTPGELVERVEPLELYQPGTPFDASTAVQLLLDSVPSTAAPLVPRDDDGPNLARIVASCEGMPLSLVLAGARLAVLGLGELCAQLEQHGSNTLRDPVQGTSVDRTIARSVDALTAVERRVLSACALFRGSFDLAGAAAVCGEDAAEGVQSLVMRSLVRARQGAGGRRRFQLWDTVRALVLTQVPPSDEARARWRGHVVAVADRFAADAVGDGLVPALTAGDDELADLLGVLGEPDPAAARVAVSGYRLLLRRLSVARLTELFLAAAPHAPTAALAARLYVVCSGTLLQLGRGGDALAAAERAVLSAGRPDGAAQRLAAAWTYGNAAWFTGLRAPAEATMRRALTEPDGDPLLRARLQSNVAELALERQAFAEALAAVDAMAEDAARVVEPNPRAWLHLRAGGLLARLCLPERALPELTAAAGVLDSPVGLDNDRRIRWYYTAAAYWLLGDLTAAERAWASLDAVPGASAPTQLMERTTQAICRLHDHPAEAAVTARLALEHLPTHDLPALRTVTLRLAIGLAAVTDVPLPASTATLEPLATFPFLEWTTTLILELVSGVRTAADGFAAATELAALPCLEARLAATLVTAAAERARRVERTWVVAADGRWFRSPDGVQVSLDGRPVLSTVFGALVRSSGSLSPEQVFAAGWPGERVASASLRNRVRVAVSTLRKLGAPPIVFTDGGYRLDPAEPVKVSR